MKNLEVRTVIDIIILLLFSWNFGVNAQGCGGTLSGQGNLSSPNYPAAYYNYGYCVWTLTAATCSSIKLQFDAFSTQSCCDYFTVYNGTNTGTYYAFRYQGYISPFTLVLESSAVVVFTSDGSVVGSGFYVEFTSVNAQGKFWCKQSQQCLDSSARCDGVQNCYPYGEDEIGCINSTTSADWMSKIVTAVSVTADANATCTNAGYYWCDQSNYCVYSWSAKCNGVANCYPHGEDEIGCNSTTSTPVTSVTTPSAPATCTNSGYYWCNQSNYCVYSWFAQCNGYANCYPYGEDEIGCAPTTTTQLPSANETCYNDGNYWCYRSARCISRSWRCDGIYDCYPLYEDETGCPSSTSAPATTTNAPATCTNAGYYWCNQSLYCVYTWPARCNGYQNCYPYGEDETGCGATTTMRATTTNAPATCINAGYYWCNRSNYCSYSWLPRCNGYENCYPYGEDEIGCGGTTPMLAVTTNAAGSCSNSGYYWCTQSNYCTYSGSARCNGETNCYPYGEDEHDCSYPTTYRWQLPYTHVSFPSTGHHLVVSWISLAASLVQLGTLIYQAGC